VLLRADFTGAKQWGSGLTDIILASGDVSFKGDALVTGSGRYAPTIIDFSERDGWKRLAEIRSAIEKGEFVNWPELVFLPLYGKEKGKARSGMVEEMLRFDIELFLAEKISDRLLAAALVMSNKMVDKNFFQEHLEVLKMIDVIDFAREYGIEEGKNLGILEACRKMVLNLLFEKFGVISPELSEKIKRIADQELLEFFFRKALKCGSIGEFEDILSRPQ
jgi:hypothetical protein